ncbi:putative C6 transcription factor [Exophiala viscosa]|uniref:C6 transcription factor n=1 Tax=Exophiala viscosa TaxID=2486360 RepID=A0AAN6E4K3_9EURO|nr:putative C6 transcription factor [Exophiala viscosa]
MTDPEIASTRQKRTLKACDFCHRRGRRCRIDPDEGARCLTCIEYGVSCTWTRIAAKRGAKPRSEKIPDHSWILNDVKHGSREFIQELLDIFFESVYPVAITIHEQTFMERWHSRQVPRGRASYAKLMSMCALSSYRITTGATFSLRETSQNLDPNLYLNEAIAAIPGTFGESLEFEYLQAIGIVCLTARECGDASVLQQFLGLYHGALAEQGFYDERRWPGDISAIEREERRRLYWHMYRLEVHTSLVLGHAVRCPELQSAVAYPIIPDQDYTESIADMEWLSGWNFITDIYRGIEHLISYFKNHRMTISQENRNLSTAFLLDYDPREKILAPLATTFQNLPERFKRARKASRDVRQNRCGFQTANIIATYQLLRMLSFTASDTTFHEACQTALELIEEISAIPLEYMRAMGLAMLQELSGLGHILSSFIKKGLPKSDYQHLRTVMLCMSELLGNLATCLSAAADAAQRLRAYVEEIDRYLNRPQSPVPPAVGDFRHYNTDVTDQHSYDSEIVIPLELLQRIPWDWAEQLQIF